MQSWDLLNQSMEQNILDNKICSSVNELNALFKENTKFKILHQNIRSVRNNFDEFCLNLNQLTFSFDIIVLTESHLQSTASYARPGYYPFYFNAKLSASDGIIIYINSDRISNPKVVAIDSMKNANAAKITFTMDNEMFSIIAVYRSPSANTRYFVTELEGYLSCISQSTHQMLIDDINLNLLDTNSFTTGKYLNVLYSNGFASCINCPTRHGLVNCLPTCIDHIFIKSSKHSLPLAGLLTSSLTDHFPIFAGWQHYGY